MRMRPTTHAVLHRATIAGFSLLEILMALMILSIGLTGLMTYFASSQARTRQSDALTVATMLARQKMGEVMLDLEKRGAEGKFPDEEEAEGQFEGRYALYAWKTRIRKVEIPMPRGEEGAENPVQLLMQQLKLDEAVRELTLTIHWKVRNRERAFQVTTHVVKL
ncbi:MAG: prepilin-type N-terminal cleavage/methylation domain-containing protein [Deltaproteobacteria bacterium]|nr:prepilin-type N-terminal cleavage/methylation domain-containing protein [Deltaproteobacteria bacterium]